MGNRKNITGKTDKSRKTNYSPSVGNERITKVDGQYKKRIGKWKLGGFSETKTRKNESGLKKENTRIYFWRKENLQLNLGTYK